jgi:hypothetical protein
MEAAKLQNEIPRHHGEEDPHVAKLGDVVQDVMVGSIRPQKTYQDDVTRAWLEVVPPNLQGQCRLNGIRHGVLHIIVSSPAYLFELQMCQQELLQHLQQSCSSVRLQQIKYRLG